MLQARSPRAEMLLLLKANAYGLGAVALAKHFLSQRKGIRLHGFGVANVEEALELRRAGIEARILVLSGIQDYSKSLHAVLVKFKLTPVISSFPVFLQAIEIFKKNHTYFPRTHLKFNTGMNRLGIEQNEVVPCLDLLRAHPRFPLDGLMSHFASAEEGMNGFSKTQIKAFAKVISQFESKNMIPKYLHFENSEGLKHRLFPRGNLVRVGLHLFGMGDPAMNSVVSWNAQIYQIRKIKKGEGVGYSQTFRAEKELTMAVIGVGYADGYCRSFSNQAYVLVRGIPCPVIGNVSMDLTAIDVTQVKDVTTGDVAILLGESGQIKITTDEMASWANTIPYEITTGISARVPRKYVP